EGQVVQPADSIYLIADLSSVWIVADIPEQSGSLVRVGEQLEAEIAALAGRRLSGALSFVSPTVNPETRTIRARMEVKNPAGDYKPAMLATVLIKGPPQNRMVVPADAVIRDENREYVFVQTADNRFQARLVTLGAEYDGMRILQAGLREGERIVVEGAFHLNNERKRRELEGA
ncbi:MAG: efflux RND transporter periplasmic adaptor subunit, partial [Burkholderiales bacterium]